MSIDNLQKLIEESRKQERESQWEGTFLEYLALVKDNPAIAQLAPGRIYTMVMEKGVSPTLPTRRPNTNKH